MAFHPAIFRLLKQKAICTKLFGLGSEVPDGLKFVLPGTKKGKFCNLFERALWFVACFIYVHIYCRWAFRGVKDDPVGACATVNQKNEAEQEGCDPFHS